MTADGAGDLPDLISTYIEMREQIEVAEEAHKQAMAALKDKFDAVSGALLDICNQQNADTIRTPYGTVSRRITSRYWTSDWSAMHKFILENEAPFLLEQRIHNGNMQQFLAENPEQVPAGLNRDSKYSVSVRKPSNK